MIDIRYTERFRLQVHHGYFGGAPEGALQVLPAWQGAPPGLPDGRFHAEGAAGRMFEAGTGAGNVGRSRLSGPAPLPFWLVARDPALAAYTALPEGITAGEAILSISNRGGAADGDRIVIQDAAAPLRRVELRPTAFRQPLAAGITGQVLRALRAHDDAVVFEVRAPAGQPFSGAVDVTLPGAADGLYRLDLDGAKILDFALARTAPRGAFAHVEIFAGGPDQDVPAAMRSVDAAGQPVTPPPRYEVRLAARQMRWRYWIRPQDSGADLGAWRIHGPEDVPDPRFDVPSRAPAAAPAPWHITSLERLALSRRPQAPLHLHAPNGGQRIPLPHPGPSALSRDGEGLLCEVFVNV